MGTKMKEENAELRKIVRSAFDYRIEKGVI